MSNKINVLLISLALLSVSSISLATGGANPQRGQRMIQELNLTTVQQSQFQEIMKEQRREAKAWRTSHHEATRNKLSHVLNADQMKKFENMKKQRGEKRKMKKRNNNYQ